jgi:broad specificity phosphatase PhoE
MLPRSFFFIRHGETDWNRQEMMQGHSDIPLNDTGRDQAAKAAAAFTDHTIRLLVVSPLLRAKETAEILNKNLKAHIILEPDIRERNFGDLEGKSYLHFEKMKIEAKEKNLPVEENGLPCPPNAEPYAQFLDRCLNGFARHLSDHADEVLFVAHGGVYRSLQRSLKMPTGHSANCEPFLFLRADQEWRLHNLIKKAA